MAMSEPMEYSLPVKVKATGFDTKRYAVVKSDTSVVLQVRSTGFNALILSLEKTHHTFELDIRNEAVRHYSSQRSGREDLCFSVALADLSVQLSEMLSSVGVHYTGSARDSLTWVLNERSSRVYSPDLGKLRINFADGYGLYGEPEVSPTEVVLYGPADVLATIGSVGVRSMTLNDVRETGTYRVPLDMIWKAQGDVYSSTEELTVNIPVKRYIERQYSVPVTVTGIDSATVHNLRLYPDHVELNVWVAQDDLASVSAERFTVTVSYDDILADQQHLKLRISRFPRNVRIRSVVPSEIEYVIIEMS